MVSCEVYSHDFGLTLFFFFFVINLSWEHLQLQSEHGGYTGTALYVKSCLNAILVVKLLHWWGGETCVFTNSEFSFNEIVHLSCMQHVS